MIFGISDLHLDHTGLKSMGVFGKSWDNYEDRIFQNWNKIVKDSDYVIIPGDISWAMRTKDVEKDLSRIEELPGKKILMKGNHDYWWQSLNKLEQLGFKSISYLQNNSYTIGETTVVGTRGWISRDNPSFSEDDDIVFKRELLRLELSIKSVKQLDKSIAMLHYPPFNRDGKPNEFFYMIKKYGIKNIVYGHLHAEGLNSVIEGNMEGIQLQCLSCDYIDFKPKLLEVNNGN